MADCLQSNELPYFAPESSQLAAAAGARFRASSFVVKTFASLTWQSTLAGILAAVAAVAVPACLVAHLKLRRRDLSAILEASGWAINARMRLTRRQADYFTCVPGYPSGARGIRRRPWLVWVLLAAAIAITVVLMVVLNGFNFH